MRTMKVSNQVDEKSPRSLWFLDGELMAQNDLVRLLQVQIEFDTRYSSQCSPSAMPAMASME